MRVFAGPNGSGKSSIDRSILNTKLAAGKTLDFGIYVNADDIAVLLEGEGFSFDQYKIQATKEEILIVANNSGLIKEEFPLDRFGKCIIVDNNHLKSTKWYLAKKMILHLSELPR